MVLVCKAVIMGATIVNNIRKITHLIAHTMSGVTVLQVLQGNTNAKIYNKNMIEYFWTNCLIIFSPYTTLNNDRLKERFRASLFMNCQIILHGFDEDSEKEMSSVIIRKGSSVRRHLCDVNTATHIICPMESNFSDAHYRELDSISTCERDKIVNYEWYKVSVDCGYLISLENYQLYNGACLRFMDDVHSGSEQSRDIKESDFKNQYDDCELQLNIETPLAGYDERLLTEKKVQDFKKQRLNDIRELYQFFKEKSLFFNYFNDFISSLITHHDKLKNVTEYFIPIEEFYTSINNILEPMTDCIDENTVFAIDVSNVFTEVKNFHRKFISDFEKLKDALKFAMKCCPIFKERFDQYLYQINFTLEGFINRPLLILTKLKLLLTSILSHSPYTHVDLPYIVKLIEDTKVVIQYFDILDSHHLEYSKQALISSCIDKAICSKTSYFVCVVDCFNVDDDGIRTPMSMFLFTDKIILSSFKDPSVANKRFSKISSSIRNRSEGYPTDYSNKTISRCSSNMSLYTSPVRSSISINNLKRKESVKSSSSDCAKTQFSQMDAVKFSKLFTGLSKLKLCTSQPVKMYSDSTIYDKSRILSAIDNTGGENIESHMFITLNMIATDTEGTSQLHLLIVPRIVKHFSDYAKFDSLFEDDYKWDCSKLTNISWGNFIVDEKHKFCEFLSKLYNIDIIEEAFNRRINLSPSNSEFSTISGDYYNFATPQANFRTPNLKSRQSNTLKSLSQNVKSTLKKIRNSVLPSPKSVKKMASIARNCMKEKDRLSTLSSGITADFSSPILHHKRVSNIIDCDEKENENEDLYIEKPINRKSLIITQKATKRKSRDIGIGENKSAKY